MARLIWKQQDGESRELSVGDDSVLGRSGGVDCVLAVKSVSRRHARIERRSEGYFIEDLGSTNGTLVNGEPVSTPVLIRRGDVIQLGEESLEFDPGQLTTGLMTRGSLDTIPLERKHAARYPQRVGKFHLVRKLGQGGMGTVFRAVDLESHREVAVKFIRRTIGRREAFLDFFHNREAVLAREIQHPNVITIYEHGVEADQHFISMEYVAGRNLFHVLRERRLEPHEVLEILRQIACGLAAAHGRGVVHSDIKPANILLAKAHTENRESEEGEDDADASPPPEDSGAEILEYDGEGSETEVSSDNGLLEEIRRRIGIPSEELLVDPPYFERLSESRFLQHYLERTLEGRGFFVLVEGEEGMGKDRLISEFLLPLEEPARDVGGRSSDPGVRLLELDCSRIEGLRHFHRQLTGIETPSKTPPRQVVSELVECFAGETRPVVLRVLNLGQSDALSGALLGELARVMPEKPLLVVAALDPDDIQKNGSLKPLLDKLAPATKELYLRPLTEYQIVRYVQQLFHEGAVSPDLANDLHRLSGGNFAKLLDLLRSFFDRRILTLKLPGGGIQYRPRMQEFELEEGKNLYDRYRAYGKAERRVLEHAAFIGPRFLFDTLLRYHKINETSLFFIVRTLLADGFFREESRTWYGFTNLTFQKYLADCIPPDERPHLHRKISRLLYTVPVPESAELLDVRARHFEGCREHAKAVQALLEGAHVARNEYNADFSREMIQDVLRIYRALASREAVRKEVTAVLRAWFRRDGNWYEILGELCREEPSATVKIADFGISFRLADDKRGYQVERRPVLGTPRYLAPERSKKDSGGSASDIFSLGIIAYEMVAGQPPFPDLKGDKVVEANRTESIVPPPESLSPYPHGMQDLLAGMLEKDPRRRWDADRVLRELVKLQFDAQMARR